MTGRLGEPLVGSDADGVLAVHFELTANTAVAVHTRNAGQAIPVHRIVCCDFFDFLSTW